MHRCLNLWMLACCAALLARAAARTDEAYLSALTYGPEEWSVITIHNPGTSPVKVSVYAYRPSGEPIGIERSGRVLAAHETAEFRVQVKTAQMEMGWARVQWEIGKGKVGMECSAALHRLSGDELRTLPRHMSAPRTNPGGIAPARSMEDHILFLANVTEHPATVRLCYLPGEVEPAGGRYDRLTKSDDECERKAAWVLAPHAAESVRFAPKETGFYVVQSQGKAMLSTILGMGPGERQRFAVDTSITFGGDEPTGKSPQ